MKDRDTNERGPVESSANDKLPVDDALIHNTGSNAPSSTRESGLVHPTDDMDDRPPFDQPGVGGRTSPRQFDEPWSHGEHTPGMGEQPSGAQQTVVPPEYEQEPEAISPVTATDQEIYADTMKANLEERGIQIEQLQAQLPGLQGEARRLLQEQIDRLSALQEEAVRRLSDLTSAGSHTWQGMTGTVEKAYTDLRSALEGAIKSYRQEK